MEPVIPALHSLWCGVDDILPAVRPAHFVALTFHQSNELLLGRGIPHTLIDGVHQPELPALPLGGGAVLPAAHAFLFHLFLRRRQDLQTAGGADLVTGQPVGLQVGGILVEFFPILEADTVYYQVIVQVVGVYVGGYQHLEV